MQNLITSLLLLAIVVVGSFWYHQTYIAGCQIPVSYSLGRFDSRFDISEAEALSAISEAEAVWEDSIGEELFVYEETGGKLTINFFFDERQELSDAEAEYRAQLDQAEKVSDRVNETYENLRTEYDDLEQSYTTDVASYERSLDRFNQKVTGYNEQGGAPPEVFESLEAERQALDREVEALNATARELNRLADRINELGDRGNQLIERYNENVRTYNDAFGESREFTQGDYSANNINIYKFSDWRELVTVLAHELGHAIRVPHVEGEESVMYYLMGEQPQELVLSQTDIEAYRTVCEEKPWYSALLPN